MNLLRSSVCCGLMASALTLGAVGCNTAPKTAEERRELTSEAAQAVNVMERDNPTLTKLLGESYAYAIFPTVGQGGLGVGGAHGHGEVYKDGAMIGYSELSFVDAGLIVGGQEYSELIVFRTPSAFANFTNNNLTFQAAASAVILKSGAGAEAKWHEDIAVFKQPRGGAMLEAGIGGQRFTYKAASNVPPAAPSTSGT